MVYCPLSAKTENETISQKHVEHKFSYPFHKATGEPVATLVNINHISFWMQADGMSGYDFTGCAGFYPMDTTPVIYCDGIVWGGLVHDGRDQLQRIGGSQYRSGLRSGRIITRGFAENDDSPDVRIWRIRRDWETAYLLHDAAKYFRIPVNDVTQDQIKQVRMQYKEDWTDWPWHKGAPFYDINGNGNMDGDDEPGLAYADQVIWYVANDLDARRAAGFGTSPIGLEMQVTLWGYNRPVFPLNEPLQHIIFKRIRLIYKGHAGTPDTARIDSMYIAQWSDPDIGNPHDDLIGCDTTLSLGYAYNSHDTDVEFTRYELPSPSMGYSLLQGPVVPSPGDRASFNMGIRGDYKNIPMTSFSWSTPNPRGDPPIIHDYPLYIYQYLKGYCPVYNHYFTYCPFPSGMSPTTLPYAGDPVTGEGHIDGQGEAYPLAPGDRRFYCGSGPFSMALGDTQEVIIAYVGGMGADRLSSISVMKYHAHWARSRKEHIFNIGFREETIPEMLIVPEGFYLYQNYPNPFNSGTEVRYDLPVQRHVNLTIFNLLGQEVKVLVDEEQAPRSYTVRWDGTGNHGEKVPTGLYLCRIEAGSFFVMKKMLLVE